MKRIFTGRVNQQGTFRVGSAGEFGRSRRPSLGVSLLLGTGGSAWVRAQAQGNPFAAVVAARRCWPTWVASWPARRQAEGNPMGIKGPVGDAAGQGAGHGQHGVPGSHGCPGRAAKRQTVGCPCAHSDQGKNQTLPILAYAAAHMVFIVLRRGPEKQASAQPVRCTPFSITCSLTTACDYSAAAGRPMVFTGVSLWKS
jgi:hypothetical protein